MPSPPSTISSPHTLLLTFTVPRRRPTNLTVSVKPDNDPGKVGCHLTFPTQPLSKYKDFPICHAKIHAPDSTGYAATYGWIQMTREGANAAAAAEAQWELDPIPITADLNTPFVWFGPEAQLFDAPSRLERVDLDWTCRSFLTYIEDSVISKKVRPVLAFEWGFWIRECEVAIKPLKWLGTKDAWEEQRSLLERSFMGWEFLPLDDAVRVDDRDE